MPWLISFTKWSAEMTLGPANVKKNLKRLTVSDLPAVIRAWPVLYVTCGKNV